MKVRISFIAICLVAFCACKKEKKSQVVDEPVGGNNAASVKPLIIKFNNVVESDALILGNKYKNPNGDTFQVSKFTYYISNVSVVKNDNSVFSVPNSYFLIDHANTSTHSCSLANVPAGEYKSVSFILGVDSARNNSGAQTGALDPIKGMFWSWNTGYIMLKLEGTSPTSGASNQALTYHIGGFGGQNKSQRMFNISFGGSQANVNTSASATINLTTNINEMFRTPNPIDFATQYYVMSPGSLAKMYADNYEDMITFKNIE
jgi:hypothetical protein